MKHLLIIAVLLFPAVASAQLGGNGCGIPGDPCFVTNQGPLEVSDPWTWAAADKTATSVTTGGGGGDYLPNATAISALDQTLFPSNGVNAQNFANLFPGWQGCEPDCTTKERTITQSVLPVYQAGLQVVQQQEQELISEGDRAGQIEGVAAGTTNVLTALQAIADLVAMDVQEHRYERQQLNTLITIQATHYAQDLNDGMQQLQTEIDTTPGAQE
jgi:hypothetical protein